MKPINKNDKNWLRIPENEFFFEMYAAHIEARRDGKRGTHDENRFEVFEMENLKTLCDSIVNRTYKPARGVAHIIHNPVIREIFAAPYQDRIVHHWIYLNIYDWWDHRFIYDSYSCREGKGTLFGIQRASHHIDSCMQKYGSANIIKLDIEGYFMRINRKKLYDRMIWGLNQQFKNNRNWKYDLLKYVIKEIILDDPCNGVRRKGWPKDWEKLPKSKSLFCQPEGVGIVIGNLTSQVFSNSYLDQLDRFVKLELKYEYYGRYVDDFFIVVPDEQLEKAKLDILEIEKYLKNFLGLTLHPKKRSIQPAKNGFAFLGATIYPNRSIYPGKRLVKNFKKAVYEVATGQRDPESITSYLGHLKYMKADKLIRQVFNSVGWDYER